MSGEKLPLRDLLAAATFDKVALLVWAQSDDAQKGVNQPKSILSVILGKDKDGELETFQEAEDFERTWAELTGVGHNG